MKFIVPIKLSCSKICCLRANTIPAQGTSLGNNIQPAALSAFQPPIHGPRLYRPFNCRFTARGSIGLMTADSRPAALLALQPPIHGPRLYRPYNRWFMARGSICFTTADSRHAANRGPCSIKWSNKEVWHLRWELLKYSSCLDY